ncbi:MAG: coenzyme F420-0:L-glutamate ligase [Acidobacteria bacterium]|nr:coenzyme F420-0:L-glutamate ligase [Acidobacteriota bacterium]
MGSAVQIIGIEGLPEVQPGDDLVGLLLQAVADTGGKFQNHDVLAIAQKIVSKAEGRLIDLGRVEPSAFALTIASQMGKDARLVEVILRETKRIVRMDHGVLITETHHGFVCANAGVDQSNVAGERVSLLPLDPDVSAAGIRQQFKERAGIDLAVIISDTFGRPWREGLAEVALGVAGLNPLVDYRGMTDRHGYSLCATVIAVADELAGAASLVFGKADGIPAALIRGLQYVPEDGSAKALIRRAEKDLFR